MGNQKKYTIQSGKYIHTSYETDPITILLQEREILVKNKEQAYQMMKKADERNFYTLDDKRKFARSWEINNGNLERLDSHLNALIDNGYLQEVA